MTIRPARGKIMPVLYAEVDFMASIEKLPAGAFNISRWSGGTTTELFIWPHGASYAERRFSIRISTATVDIAESTFTKLPGVTRYIAPLGDGFTLKIGQNEPEFIPHAAVKRFDGGEDVTCAGTGRDLNLMLSGAAGELIMIKPNERHIVRQAEFLFAYAVQDCRISVGSVQMNTESGEFLRIYADAGETVTASGEAGLFYAQP